MSLYTSNQVRATVPMLDDIVVVCERSTENKSHMFYVNTPEGIQLYTIDNLDNVHVNAIKMVCLEAKRSVDQNIADSR